MKPRKFLQAAVCASVLAVGAASPAVWAQPAPAAQHPAPAAQAQGQKLLSIREVYDLLEKQGYRNFTEIDLERRRRGPDAYEVKADNAAGDYVKLYVDAYNGNVLSERNRSERDRSERRNRR